MNIQEIKKFISKNDLNVQEAKTSIFGPVFVYLGYMKMKDVYPSGFGNIIGKFQKEYFWQYLSQNKLNILIDELKKEYIENKTIFNKRYEKWLQTIKKLNKFCKDLKIENLKTKNKIDIWNSYEKFSAVFTDFWKYASVGEEKGLYIEEVIVPNLAKKWNLDEIKTQEYLFALIHPESISIFTQERLDFYALCISNMNGKLINEYKNKYFWKKTDFYQALNYTPRDIIKEIEEYKKNRNRNEIIDEINKIKDELISIGNNQNEIKKKVKLSEYDKKVIDFIKKMSVLGDERKEPMMIGFHYLFKFLKLFADKAGIKYEDASLIVSNAELKKLAIEGKVDKNILKRKQECLIVFDEKQKTPNIFYNKDFKDIINAIGRKNMSSILKGTVASTGGKQKIGGIVKIVLKPDVENFDRGKILVTGMTRVEFVPLMKKAKAIITNEGGMTCHAAIVSRELKIPCIIGTKKATTFLKDGQRITLDLKNGLIRLI